jgi:hypothetical protein
VKLALHYHLRGSKKNQCIAIHGYRIAERYEAVDFILKCNIVMHGTALAANFVSSPDFVTI